MTKDYRELVVAGSFALVKGFLLGFRCGSGREFSYFFHHKSGIRRDTLTELVKDVLELDNYVHLCLEEDVVESFKEAVAKAGPVVGIEVRKERRIKEARFDFSFRINNRRAADKIKETLNNLPQGVKIEGYEPQELTHKNEEKATAGYAPIHAYDFKGSGVVRGDFGGIMELFLKIKRMPESELMLMGDIVLNFEN
jgi:hypothetical protein